MATKHWFGLICRTQRGLHRDEMYYTEMKCTLGSQKFLTYFDSSTSPTKKNIVYLNSNDTLD